KSLSQVISELGVERIDLLKIDAEKSELEILAGIEQRDWPRVRQLVVEVQDNDGRLKVITNLIEAHNFKVMVEQDRLLSTSGLYYVYAVRPRDKAVSLAKSGMGLGDETNRSMSRDRLVSALSLFLKQKLPEYMVPSTFVMLEE